MTGKTDEQLIELVVAKDSEALNQLYHRYEIQIFNFLLRSTGNREIAQEMLQETFTRLWFVAQRFDPQRGRFKTWFYTLALNITRTEMSKKEYKFKFLAPEDLKNPCEVEKHLKSESPYTELEKQEIQSSVVNALKEIHPRLREVIVMKNYQHLKFREIADIVNTPESTIKSRYHKAISELKKKLLAVNKMEVAHHLKGGYSK